MDKRPNHYYSRTYYQAQHQPPVVKRRKRNVLQRFFNFSLLVLILAITALLWVKHDKASAHKVPTYQPTAQSFATMDSTINGLLSANSGIDTSVSVLGSGSSSQFSYGDNSAVDAASEGKLITAGAFLHDVETRQASLSGTLDDGNNAKDDLEAMIVNSDDGAWNALNDELGTQLQTYANSLGLAYDSANNTITAGAITSFLSRLANNQLYNSDDTQLFLTYLGQANYRNFMVPAVPGDDEVFHKVGLDNDQVNDAAIISREGQAVAVTILTNGNGVYNWPVRAQLMQQIVKAVITCYFGQS